MKYEELRELNPLILLKREPEDPSPYSEHQLKELTQKIQRQLFKNDLPDIVKMPNSQKVIINKHILETFVKTIMEELEA